jgi:uncharacterized integral membrane protein
MQFFFWLAFLVIAGLAIFAIQNSTASVVTMKFLIWEFETSLVYTILGAIGAGMLIVLLLWIPSAIRGSFRSKNLKKEVEILERRMKHEADLTKPKDP